MVPFNCFLGKTELLLYNLGLDAQVREFVAKALVLYPEVFPLLLAQSHFLVQHDRALDSDVVFGLQIL